MTTVLRACVALILLFAERSAAFPAAGAEVESINYPTIVMTTDLIPPATIENTWLEDRDGTKAKAVRVDAVSVPITIALVVSSDRTWLRSDEMDNDQRPTSGYELVDSVVRDLTVSSFGPDGSQLLIITYDRDARISLPPTDSDELPTQPIGGRQIYNREGHAMELGLGLGLDQLALVSTPRKLLVLIGDGRHDQSARSSLVVMEKRARDESVELAAINYPLEYAGQLATDPNPLTGIIPARVVTTAPQAVEELRRLVSTTRQRYRIQLDGRQLSWDGEMHPVTLRAGSFDIGPRLLHFPHHASPPRTPPLSHWRWPLAVLALLSLVGLIAIVRR